MREREREREREWTKDAQFRLRPPCGFRTHHPLLQRLVCASLAQQPLLQHALREEGALELVALADQLPLPRDHRALEVSAGFGQAVQLESLCLHERVEHPGWGNPPGDFGQLFSPVNRCRSPGLGGGEGTANIR